MTSWEKTDTIWGGSVMHYINIIVQYEIIIIKNNKIKLPIN